MDSHSYEDAIRTAISVGGDSDTLAAITGSIAEAYYGVPEDLKQKALTYLDDGLRAFYEEWRDFSGEAGTTGKFKVLTKYIPRMTGDLPNGEWVSDKEGYDLKEWWIRLSFVHYSDFMVSFLSEVHDFARSHPEYKLNNYRKIIEKNGLEWEYDSLKKADPDRLDEQCILALVVAAVRMDRFSEGVLRHFLEDGYLLKWLKRLEAMDKKNMASSK